MGGRKHGKDRAYRVGVLSDTHGLLRAEVIETLQDADRIIHAGDVGTLEVLRKLRGLAPVTVVRGNMDNGGWAIQLPETEAVELGGVWAYVLHDVYRLDLDPGAAGFQMVISGHTHRPSSKWSKGALFLNPGSAGARRARLPATMALLEVEGEKIETRFVTLEG